MLSRAVPKVCRAGIRAGPTCGNEIRFTIGVPGSRASSVTCLPVSSGFPVRSCVELYGTSRRNSLPTVRTTEGSLRHHVGSRTGRVGRCISSPSAAPFTVVCLTARKLCTRVTSNGDTLSRRLRTRNVVVTNPDAVATLLGSLTVNFHAVTVGGGTARI